MNYPYRKKKPIRSSTPVARPAKGLDTRDIRDIDRTGRAADRPAATATESDSPSYPAPRARANPPETAMATTREQSEAVSPGGSSCGRSPNGIAPLRTSRRRSFKSAGSPTSSDCRRAVSPRSSVANRSRPTGRARPLTRQRDARTCRVREITYIFLACGDEAN